MSSLFNSGHSLIVGVGNDLPITVKDAQLMKDLLADSQRAAYPPDQIRFLTEKEATRDKILAGFDQLAKTTDENSTVLIYYSGHGGLIEESNEFFFVPNNFDRNNYKETWIKAEEFTERVEAIKAKKKIVLLDCCHSGGMAKDGPSIHDPGLSIGIQKRISNFTSLLDRGSGSIIFSSSRDNEFSYIMPGDANSLFTLCFKEAIEGHVPIDEQDEGIRILDILSYVFKQVPPRSNDKQHPYINRIEDLSDNFILCMPPLKMRNKSLTSQAPGSRMASLIQREINGLVQPLQFNNKKLTFLRNQLEIQSDPSMKFTLEQQILEQSGRRAVLMDRIKNLTAELQSLN